MIRIRTKLLIYFVAILLLMILLFFLREHNALRIVELQEERSDYYFLLNEITNSTDQAYQSLQIFVHEPTDENLHYYEEEKQRFTELQQQFVTTATDNIDKKNYLHLLSSFLELTDQTVEGVLLDDIERYSYYLNEANTSATYVHERTLELMNSELTVYQHVMELEDQRFQYIKNMGTAFFISAVILCVLFALWFSNGITKGIERLTEAAKQISVGNYTVEDVEVPQNDELKILTKTFNQMRVNIVEAIREMKDKARMAQLLKEMELKSLQNQINPHFLFNTLNVISKTAYIEEAERTNALITSVSALLRYNISSLDRETSLKDEVEVVREYFFIQQARFGDRIAFQQDIDEGCLETLIPSLTLQPIVENAFIHGIEEMTDGAEISLKIYPQGEKVWIEIADNGKGMEQVVISRILSAEESKDKNRKGHSTGIGMRNVIDRLKLFDEQSDVTIESTLGIGTKVTIGLRKELKK
ncbi:sensor histidine kinase [Gracilibacillus sp. S3-1-1]|uniref:Sensor histidine kinase n=1 Tax=Gracilibacillus pellucidus TaxID=3095368 RepID=A0ACC6M635_9BACI|nr:sensor histidine kinase [Gracilibacillus sp. S3-1-1]MDX8046431.1 sensor histidine kinase [Gracilibacillus sp. S3-1-1]